MILEDHRTLKERSIEVKLIGNLTRIDIHTQEKKRLVLIVCHADF